MRGIRIVLVLVLLAIAGMWIYVLLIADPKPHPDRLEDRGFPATAEPICARTQAAIGQLPPADEARDRQERADVVDDANRLLRAMVADLEDGAPREGEDGRITQEWLSDWSTYITDRADWADQTSAGENVRFFETEKGGGPISRLIDQFADVNDMPSSATPSDL